MESINDQELNSFGKKMLIISAVCLLSTVLIFNWFIFAIALIILINAFLVMIIAKEAYNINQRSKSRKLRKSEIERPKLTITPISSTTKVLPLISTSKDCCDETKKVGRYYCICGKTVIT